MEGGVAAVVVAVVAVMIGVVKEGSRGEASLEKEAAAEKDTGAEATTEGVRVTTNTEIEAGGGHQEEIEAQCIARLRVLRNITTTTKRERMITVMTSITGVTVARRNMIMTRDTRTIMVMTSIGRGNTMVAQGTVRRNTTGEMNMTRKEDATTIVTNLRATTSMTNMKRKIMTSTDGRIMGDIAEVARHTSTKSRDWFAYRNIGLWHLCDLSELLSEEVICKIYVALHGNGVQLGQ